MRIRARFLRLLLSLPCLAGLLVSWPALAQTITFNRVQGNRTRGAPGTIGISHQDCIDDISLSFALSVSGLTGTYDLQVWGGQSGADCQDPNNRTGTIARCRQIAPSQRTTSTTYEIAVRAQDLAATLLGPPPPANYTAADASACEVQTTPGAQTVSVWFMIMNGATIVTATPFKATQPTTTSTTTPAPAAQEGVVVDLRGPDAPTDVRVSTGDRRLRLDWTGNGDRDIKGYVFYCQPADQAPPSDGGAQTVCVEAGSSTPPASDAGADADADAEALIDAATIVETTDDASCVVQPAASSNQCPAPAVTAATECGRIIQVGATSGNTDRKLTNGTDYATAVAALDAFDNVGPAAAATTCGIPEAVVDFWTAFNAAGGNAGGYCALEAVGLPVGSNAIAVGLSVGLFAVVRRRRRKS
jgi:hypothetical protein